MNKSVPNLSFKLISTMSMKLSKEFLNISTLTKHIKLELEADLPLMLSKEKKS